MNKKDILYVLIVISMILQVVAISTEEWSTKSIGGGNKQKMGLWKVCTGQGCVSLPPNDPSFPKNALNAVRVFAVMAAVANFLALIDIYDNYGQNQRKRLRLLVLAGVSGLAAMVVWAKDFAKLNHVKYDLGYSFHLNWAAGVLSLGAAAYMYWGNGK